MQLTPLLKPSGAVLRQVMNRLKNGPVRPGWGWRRELLCAASRSLFEAMAQMNAEQLVGFQRHLTLRLSQEYRATVDLSSQEIEGVRCEVFRPKHVQSDNAILYLHGGAYGLTNTAIYRPSLCRLASLTNTTVIMPDYVSSFEKPFPAALEQCCAVYRQLLGKIFAEELIIAGDSAGGGLTLALLQMLRMGGMPQPAGAIVISPWTDLTLTSETLSKNENSDMLSLQGLHLFAEKYSAQADLSDPLLSPVFGDYTDIAPLLFFAGEAEMLLADTEKVVHKAKQSGVEVTYHRYPETAHVGMFTSAEHLDLAFSQLNEFVKNRFKSAA